MRWNKLEEESQLDSIIEESKEKPVLLFKHSTRCSISSMALNRLERQWQDSDEETVKPYYLDLIAFRPISNKIAADLGVDHQSPQAILLKDGKAVWDASHNGIRYEEILEEAHG